MHTQQRHRRSHRHDTQTGKRNDPPPTPPHAREVVRNHTDCKPIATATRVRQRDHTRQTLHRRVRARPTVATLQRHSREARCTSRGLHDLPPRRRTLLPTPPTHAKSCVIVRDGPPATRRPTMHSRQNHLRGTRTLPHAYPCISDARRTTSNAKRCDTYAIA